MKKYDSVIEETIGGFLKGAWNTAGDAINAAKNIGSIATKVATDPSIKNFTDLFSKIKTKLKLVDHASALKNAGFNSGISAAGFDVRKPVNSYTGIGTSVSSKLGKVAYKYTPSSFIIDSGSEVSGVVGKVINYNNDKYFQNFLKYLKDNNINYDNIKNETKANDRFWVVISPAGSETVDAIENSPEPEPTTPEPAPTTPAPVQSGQSTLYASYDQKIQNYYSIISEGINLKSKQPQNSTQYDTWFIVKPTSAENQINVGKILIYPKGQKVPSRYGIGVNMAVMGSPGLVLCGNKTLYPKWYFLNDFEEYTNAEKSKDDKGPQQLNLKSRSIGDDIDKLINKANNNTNQTQNP